MLANKSSLAVNGSADQNSVYYKVEEWISHREKRSWFSDWFKFDNSKRDDTIPAEYENSWSPVAIAVLVAFIVALVCVSWWAVNWFMKSNGLKDEYEVDDGGPAGEMEDP